ncbi:protein YgfX [Shewanella fodinae]|uniref:Toxin CptA n=1 Tax=Shewanella fodinae TaxID=552357 RepID=A0A4R2FF63_9GAMM|nr:protein YgfX [Shewanella fodinae]TCN87927.1 toxin CptA [Shewanella fodinae]
MQRRRFTAKSSVGQYLALGALAAICLLSFRLWPALDFRYYQPLRWGLMLSVISYFGYQLWRLRDWSVSFWLSGNGQGLFDADQMFTVGEPVLVTPWLVSFRCLQANRFQRLYLFRDMFDDTDYRHLCRLLLNRDSPYSG